MASIKVWAWRIASRREAQTPTVTVRPFPTVHCQLRGNDISATEKAMPRCSTELSVHIEFALNSAVLLSLATVQPGFGMNQDILRGNAPGLGKAPLG